MKSELAQAKIAESSLVPIVSNRIILEMMSKPQTLVPLGKFARPGSIFPCLNGIGTNRQYRWFEFVRPFEFYDTIQFVDWHKFNKLKEGLIFYRESNDSFLFMSDGCFRYMFSRTSFNKGILTGNFSVKKQGRFYGIQWIDK